MDLFLSLMFRINQEIRDRNLLQSHDRILLTVSGGQDSICLILFFVFLREHWRWDLGCIHCDHGWRKDARKNAYHVLQIAEKYNIPYFQVLPTKKFISEDKARNWRYLKIIEIACEHNYKSIVTGHTGTDRAETMFINLTRGSGCGGLHSLQWKRSHVINNMKKIQIIRPLLSLQREELKTIVNQLHFPLWPDITNQDIQLTRNLIRKQIFPYLRFVLNRNLDKSFAQFTELSHCESIFFDNITKKILVNLQIDSSSLDIVKLQLIPIALQRRVIRLFAKKKTKQLLEFEEIEKIRYLCLNPTNIKTLSLKKGLLFIKMQRLFFIRKKNFHPRAL